MAADAIKRRGVPVWVIPQYTEHGAAKLKSFYHKFPKRQKKMAKTLHLTEEEEPDNIAGTETWLNADISSSEFFPSNYQIMKQDRVTGFHGGVLLALRSDLAVKRIDTPTNIETVFAKMKTQPRGAPLIVCSIYQPTNNHQQYMHLLCNSIVKICKSNRKLGVWLCGDLNLPEFNWYNIDVTGNQCPSTINQTFVDTVISYSLSQIVDEPTRNGKILDLFLTNRPSQVSNCSVIASISDYNIVTVTNHILHNRRNPSGERLFLEKKADIPSLRKSIAKLKDQYIAHYHDQTQPVMTSGTISKCSLKRLNPNMYRQSSHL